MSSPRSATPTFFEVLLPDAAQKYGLEQDIVVGRDGMVHVPNGPGLGRCDRFQADRAQEDCRVELRV